MSAPCGQILNAYGEMLFLVSVTSVISVAEKIEEKKVAGGQ